MVHRAPFPIWWLPFLAGALPAVGVAIAFPLAVDAGQFASCNPLLEGCVSISRAARHGLSNHLFRALLLPAAVLQGMVWWLCAAWARSIGAPPSRQHDWLPWLGAIATVALVLYGTFLGTEGAWYRWMRRYGVVFYFGGTCILMLLVAGAVRQAAAADARWARYAAALLGLACSLPVLGVVNTLAPLAMADPVAVDRFENATEWWGGLVFTLFFGALAMAWRRSGFGLRPEIDERWRVRR